MFLSYIHVFVCLGTNREYYTLFTVKSLSIIYTNDILFFKFIAVGYNSPILRIFNSHNFMKRILEKGLLFSQPKPFSHMCSFDGCNVFSRGMCLMFII
jgi:hypothetical protein